MNKRPKIPKFGTEVEEAQWWDNNMTMVENELSKAMADGTATRGTALRIAREAHSRNITIRMPESEIERAMIFDS